MKTWKLTKAAKTNLSLLADKLDTVPEKYFNMSSYGHNVNGASCGCIVHHAATMPRFMKRGLVYDSINEIINPGDSGIVYYKFAEVMGIDEDLAYNISLAWGVKTPKAAAKRLRTLVDTSV